MPVTVDPALFAELQTVIPHGRFRSKEQAKATTLAYRKDRHVLAVLPTGVGKSFTFFLPA